jgi:hypothetical protein
LKEIFSVSLLVKGKSRRKNGGLNMAESDIRRKENVEHPRKRRKHNTSHHETVSSHRQSSKIAHTPESVHEDDHHPHLGSHHRLHDTGGRMTKAAKTLIVLMVLGAIGLISLVNAREIRKELTISAGGRQSADIRSFRADMAVLNIDKIRIDETQLSSNIVNQIMRSDANPITVTTIERNLDISEGCNAINSEKIVDSNSIAKEIITYDVIGTARAGSRDLSIIKGRTSA